jgi:hypothetical protein
MKYILTIILLLLAASAWPVTVADTVKYGIDDVAIMDDTGCDRTYGFIAPGDAGPGSRDGGYRFRLFPVPAGATIDSAYPYFWSPYANGSDTCRWLLYFEDTASADTFSTGANAASRNLTSSVAWLPDDWSGDTRYRGPDLKTILQHVIDRADYDSANNVVMFMKNNGSTYEAYRYTGAYEAGAGQAAYMTVYYTEGGSAPVDTANSLYRKVSTRKGTYR